MSKCKTSEERAEMGLSRSMVRKIGTAADSLAFGRTPYLYISDKVVGEGFCLKMDFLFY